MSNECIYSVEREYPVSIADLWSAWTDATKLEAWYFPTALKSVVGATTSELEVGGLWSCAVDISLGNIQKSKITNVSSTLCTTPNQKKCSWPKILIRLLT